MLKIILLSLFIISSFSIKPPEGSSYQSFFPQDSSNSQPSGLYITDPQVLGINYQKAMLPLRHIDYTLEVVNSLAHIILRQEYYNPSDKFLNVYFSFPINPKSAIYKMLAQFGNKVVEGVIKEKEKAREEFQEAKRAGNQVVLTEIDANSRDIIRMNIGNIPPETRLIITISFVQEMTLSVSTFYRIQVPSTISPRYMNSVPLSQVKMDQLDPALLKDINTKITWTSGFTWNFNIILKTYRYIAFYNSTTHRLRKIHANENRKQILLKLEQETLPNKDFVFLYTTQDFQKPSYVIGDNEKCSTVQVSFIPKFSRLKDIDEAYRYAKDDREEQVDLRSVKGEFVFILDRSGSMDSASRIGKVKQALITFLKTLPQNSYFNIISFGNTFSPMYQRSEKYQNSKMRDAIYKVEQMLADFGGTQIYQPLDYVLSQPEIQGYPRFVFLLTDGQVSNTQSVIRMVKMKSRNTRINSIGIGNGASEALIQGTAEAGKGRYIMLTDDESPTKKIINLLHSAFTPLITHFNINFQKQLVESVIPNPQNVPYILYDDTANFYLMFKQKLERKIKITMEYQDSVTNLFYSEEIQIQPKKQESFSFVDKMARFKVLRVLEMLAESQNNQLIQISNHLAYKKYDENNSFKKQAEKYSVEYQILSEYTSFIAIIKQFTDQQKNTLKIVGKESIQIAQPISDDQRYSFSVSESFLAFKWWWCFLWFIWWWENDRN